MQSDIDRAETVPYFRSFFQKEGTAVQGTWAWGAYTGQTNFASVTGETAGQYMNNGTHADLDEYKWSNVYLTKGRYKITLIHWMLDYLGIAEVLLGSVSLGTKDMYAAVIAFNQVWDITFTLTTDQTADLRFRVNGKNALSSNHYVVLSRLQLEKVG